MGAQVCCKWDSRLRSHSPTRQKEQSITTQAPSKLKDLVLDNNQISDVSPLRDLMTLQELYVGRNKLTSVEAIGSLKKLYILNLSGNQIKDVNSLSGLSVLIVLDLKNNPIAENKTASNCPTADGISQALRDFCNQ